MSGTDPSALEQLLHAVELTSPADRAHEKRRALRASELRAVLLRACDAECAADYFFLETDVERAERTAKVLPPTLVDDAKRVMYRRMELVRDADEHAAWKTATDEVVDRECSRWARMKHHLRHRVKWSVPLKLVPWSILLPLAVVWLSTKTIRKPVLEARAKWEMRSKPLSSDDSKVLREGLGWLWISRLANDTMKDLPAACASELTHLDDKQRLDPSRPCVDDVTQRLDRLVATEQSELDTITLLKAELDSSTCGPMGPAHARMLFDVDFLSDMVADNPSAFHAERWTCKGATTAATGKLEQYRNLVEKIASSSNSMINVLRPARSTQPDPAVSPFDADGAVTIVIRNSGSSDAELDLHGAQLTSDDQPCASTELVVLDSYTRKKTAIVPDERIVVHPGSSAKIELFASCAKLHHRRWKLRHDDGELDVSFSM